MDRNIWSSLLNSGKPFQCKGKSPTATWSLIGIRRADTRMKKSFIVSLKSAKEAKA
jgi:hypothetical protein